MESRTPQLLNKHLHMYIKYFAYLLCFPLIYIVLNIFQCCYFHLFDCEIYLQVQSFQEKILIKDYNAYCVMSVLYIACLSLYFMNLLHDIVVYYKYLFSLLLDYMLTIHQVQIIAKIILSIKDFPVLCEVVSMLITFCDSSDYLYTNK